jgi:glycopeptide antibiotics resistance protein
MERGNHLKTMKKRLIPAFILIVYSVLLIKIMVFKDVPTVRIGSLILNFGGTDAGGQANFLPFKTILPYLLGEKGYIIAGINLVGNVALLVPIGFLAPFVYLHMTWKKTLALAVTVGLAIEGMQTVLRVGIFDIDDVILNALGVMSGYWAFAILTMWVRLGKYKNIIITAIMVIAATAAAFYAVYPKGQPPVNSRVGAGNVQSDRIDNGEGEIPQSVDLCAGTGGTGQIVSLGNNTITIKRKDGIVQTINLTDQTTIRISASPASKSDLKTGDRVTLVVDDSQTATTVLVCNIAGSQTHSGQ